MMQGMLRGTMGGLELSGLTGFGKFIDSFSGKLLSDSSVRIPFAGLENPAWAGWSHGDVPCEPKKAPGSSWPGKFGKGTGIAGYVGPFPGLVSHLAKQSTEGGVSTYG